MARGSKKFFIWLPRVEAVSFKIEVDGTDESSHVVDGGFTNAIIGEAAGFEIRLENNNERFTNLYSGNEDVNFYLDFASATNKRFVGKVEKIDKVFGEKGNVILISGTQKFHSELLDKNVTESYSGASADAILKDLVAKYLSGYTTTNVNAVSTTPSLKWEGVPLYDAILDLCNSVDCDCYVDVNADFHFFKRNSVENNDEAVVSGDNLIAVEGLKTDVLDVKNKVQVTSEDNEGLPIIYTSTNSSSQTTYGIKEQIIKESNLANITQAKEVADYNIQGSPEDRGKTLSFMLPSLAPGDYVWVSQKAQDIHDQHRIVKYTHKLFQMTTEATIAKSKDLPGFLKERKQREAALAKLKNPFRMEYSFNLEFDNEEDISSKDSNIVIQDGEVRITSGSEGTLTTVTHDAPIDATTTQLQVIGENIADTVFKVSTNGGASYKTIKIDELTSVTAGDKIRLQIEINNANTVIKSIALLYK